jgi:hypothetical protein
MLVCLMSICGPSHAMRVFIEARRQLWLIRPVSAGAVIGVAIRRLGHGLSWAMTMVALLRLLQR